ncbi:MAPEG family protein [Sulfitobacter sp. F26204]|uniref:MAPEG family protein n=1 Tax=Sulfitobacter sp. F26204 TaxID=2996014 RepID=UPI00225E4DC1|nr:MAPEG family protein [Sulfitobacter sp. F26204]MCX7560917.1 MAPEG family protein [Sulfitobacter sp. F26204]
MPLTLTSFYAALTALVFLVLSWRVIQYRRASSISLGDTGDKNLLKRMRAQANCAEYSPIALILLMLTELNGAPAIAIHLMGIALVAGRVLHPLGFASTPQKIVLRQLGMLLTLGMIAFSALGLIGHSLL